MIIRENKEDRIFYYRATYNLNVIFRLRDIISDNFFLVIKPFRLIDVV